MKALNTEFSVKLVKRLLDDNKGKFCLFLNKTYELSEVILRRTLTFIFCKKKKFSYQFYFSIWVLWPVKIISLL